MPVYARVKDAELLRKHVAAKGLQVEVATLCGLSPQRFSALITGTAPVINLNDAATIERVLGVAPRTLFIPHNVGDPELLARYLAEPSTPDTADPQPPAE